MSDDSSAQDWNRYAVSGNPEAQYSNPGEYVLVNKKGITGLRTLHIEEEKGLARAYEQLLSEVLSDTPITSDLIRYTHGVIFRELYEWAGRWRTVKISKPGVTWPPPDFLEQGMQDFERDVLQHFPASDLTEDDAFCRALGLIQGEFLSIHPFREGNARTIKLVTDLLAIQTHRLPLRYDMSDEGKWEYITAAKAALMQEFSLMTDIIRKALAASR